jgi:hypothetical protein
MREGYETKIQENLARAAELETEQSEFDRQVAEYCEISDLIADTANSGITAKVIDYLVGSIKFYSDKSIEVDFLFDSGFDLVSETQGLDKLSISNKSSNINKSVRYDSRKGDAGNTAAAYGMGVAANG